MTLDFIYTLKDTHPHYESTDVEFDYIDFTSGEKDYVIDTTGEVEFVIGSKSIFGKFKGDISSLEPEAGISQEEIEAAILNMDTNTFRIGLFDDGTEPCFTRLDVKITLRDKIVEFSIAKDKEAVA